MTTQRGPQKTSVDRITLFTIPRAFKGATGERQRNALQSWLRLGPDYEVVVLAEDDQVAMTAEELGISVISQLAVNRYGTPLLNDAFRKVIAQSRASVFAYVNSDIILMSDFARAVDHVRRKCSHFLMVGRRLDLDLEGLWTFDESWERRLSKLASSAGHRHGPTAVDYFVFDHEELFESMPDFAVGRPGWDNWVIAHALQAGLVVIDASEQVTAIHQNHGYAHVKESRGIDWEGPEADANRALAGTHAYRFTTYSATRILSETGLRRAISAPYVLGRIAAFRARHPSVDRTVTKMARALRKRIDSRNAVR